MTSDKNKKEDIVDVFDAFLNSRFEGIHTSIPAEIQKYDASKRKAEVKVLVNLVRKNGDILEVPVLDNIPVQFPSCSSFSLTFDLKKGDKGALVFSEMGIGGYLSGSGKVTEADSPARFQLTDGWFIPGVYPFSIVPNSSGNISVDAQGVIAINGDTDNGVRYSELELAFNQLKADHDNLAVVVNTHAHLYAPGPGALIPTTLPTLPTPPYTPSPPGGVPGVQPSTADISGAKIEEVKVS